MTASVDYRMVNMPEENAMQALNTLWRLWIILVVMALTPVLTGQAGDFDLEIRLDREGVYRQGDTVTATHGMVSRAGGTQGWSFGIRHDPSILRIESVTMKGSDAEAALVNPSFTLTEIIESKDGTRIGIIQGVVLSFIEPAEVPVSDFFSFCFANYSVLQCDDDEQERNTAIRFVSDLSQPGRVPVEINLTVDGRAILPEQIDAAVVAIDCREVPVPPEPDLALSFGPKGPCELQADREATADVEVLVSNRKKTRVDLQGWSYSVSVDHELLECVGVTPGPDVAALNGGEGPEFLNYNLNDQNIDGAVTGVSVGAVVQLGPPGTEVLSLGSGATIHLDSITVRSLVSLVGDESREAPIAYVDITLGEDRPMEILFVVDGNGVVPDFAADKSVILQGVPVPVNPSFIRGDANNDSQVNIADGIWIVQMMFYNGQMTACLPAADANNDGKLSISDALYILNYRLQPGSTNFALYDPPEGPYPECGSVEGITTEDCPEGSHICFPAP